MFPTICQSVGICGFDIISVWYHSHVTRLSQERSLIREGLVREWFFFQTGFFATSRFLSVPHWYDNLIRTNEAKKARWIPFIFPPPPRNVSHQTPHGTSTNSPKRLAARFDVWTTRVCSSRNGAALWTHSRGSCQGVHAQPADDYGNHGKYRNSGVIRGSFGADRGEILIFQFSAIFFSCSKIFLKNVFNYKSAQNTLI